MNDKIVIDKESIEEFEKVTVYFHESYYTFDIGAVTDIHFDVKVEKRSGNFHAIDGFIELTPEAGKVTGLLIDDYYSEEEHTESFLSRLKKGIDVYRLCFTSNKKELTVFLPCNPLTDCKGNVIENSNCPSFDVSPHGNLRIYAGQSSKSPKREKLIYSDICKNWDRVMGKNYRPDVLDVEMKNIAIEEDGIAIKFDVFNPQSPVCDIEFFFENCKIHSFDMYLGQGDFSTDIELARMTNGHIYACLQECGICLECSGVSVYIVVD